MESSCPKCGSRDLLDDGSCRICEWKPVGAKWRTFPQVQGFRVCVGDGIRREQWVDAEGRSVVTRHERAGVFGIEAALGVCQEWFRLYGERCLLEPVFVES